MEMEFNSPSLSEEDEEEKVGVRVDSCLLCALPAVTYDADGNVIKKEPEEEVRKKNWSNDQLFLFLCRNFGLGRKQTYSGLQLDPFPFCELCELLINSLGDVYTKLEELQSVLKGKIEEAEGIYFKENLYESHSEDYWQFRKDVLGVKKVQKKPIMKAKGHVVLTNEEPEPIPSGFEVGDDDVSPTRQLRKRTIQVYQQYIDEPSLSSSDEEEKPKAKSITKKNVAVPKTKRKKEIEPPKQKRKYTRKPRDETDTLLKKTRRKTSFEVASAISRTIVSKCSDTVPIKVESTQEPLQLKRSTYFASNRGFMERDPTTGSITYTTGHGNRFKNIRTTLVFKQIEKEGGTLGYECTSCSEQFPLHLGTNKQQRIFREHYLITHSDRYKCRLCNLDTIARFKNREELFQHLESTHQISTMADYHTAIGIKLGRPKESHMKRKPNYSKCPVCEMPFVDRRKSAYQSHLRSHMNEEERAEALLVEGGRNYKELPTATVQQLSSGSINQCHSCGQFITNGEKGLRKHQIDVHEPQDVSTGFICAICGVSLKSNQGLEQHTMRRHPDGKVDLPFKCNFPACPQHLVDEPSLKVHIEEAHGQSQEATSNVMCTICGKISVSSWCLKQHLLVHSGARPHKCHLCLKGFPIKSTLKLHLFTKHLIGAETWKCEEEGCNRVFPNRIYFRTHMRNKHGQRVKKRKKRNVNEGDDDAIPTHQ